MNFIMLFFTSLAYAFFNWLLAQPFRLIGNVFAQLFKGNGVEALKAIGKLVFVPFAAWVTVAILGSESVWLFGLVSFVGWVVLMLFFGAFLHSTVSVKLFDIQGAIESLVLGHTWGIIVLILMTIR